jgi:hypothetical protein
VIELVGIDMEEIVIPGPEDYARDLEVIFVVNDRGLMLDNTGSDAATEHVMRDNNYDIGKGFAERTDALSMTIFTNAQDGAALYVHGIQPLGPQGILRLEDTYVQVCTEKTYILQNDLEGAYADACSTAVAESGIFAVIDEETDRVEDNPRNAMGGEVLFPIFPPPSNVAGGPWAAEVKALGSWLRINNQAQHIFEVKMATKAPRLIVFNLGIGNLARYTEGDYTNTLVFTLIPIVG